MTSRRNLTDNVYLIETMEITDPKVEQIVSNELLVLFKNLMTQSECSESVVVADDEMTMYLFLDEDRSKQIIDFLDNIGLIKCVKEISEEILHENYNEDFKETFSEPHNNEILNQYIFNNLTTDIVLEKISSKGIDSLNSFDYLVLEFNVNNTRPSVLKNYVREKSINKILKINK